MTLLVLSVGFVGWQSAVRMDGYVATIGTISLPEIESLRTIQAETNQVKAAVRTLLNPRLTLSQRVEESDALLQTRADYARIVEEFASSLHSEEQTAFWETFEIELAQLVTANNRVLALAEEVEAIGILNPYKFGREIAVFNSSYHAVMLTTLESLMAGQRLVIETSSAEPRWDGGSAISRPVTSE